MALREAQAEVAGDSHGGHLEEEQEEHQGVGAALETVAEVVEAGAFHLAEELRVGEDSAFREAGEEVECEGRVHYGVPEKISCPPMVLVQSDKIVRLGLAGILYKTSSSHGLYS